MFPFSPNSLGHFFEHSCYLLMVSDAQLPHNAGPHPQIHQKVLLMHLTPNFPVPILLACTDPYLQPQANVTPFLTHNCPTSKIPSWQPSLWMTNVFPFTIAIPAVHVLPITIPEYCTLLTSHSLLIPCRLHHGEPP